MFSIVTDETVQRAAVKLFSRHCENHRAITGGESLRLMREHLNTRDQVQGAYNELRERIDRRLEFPGLIG